MRPLKLTILLLITSAQLFSQEVRPYEDFYESGKIYVRGFNVQDDSTSSADIGLWTYWYENGNKLSEEIRNDPHLTKYINCWTSDGEQICKNGNGLFYQTWTDFVADSTVYTIRDSIKQGHYISYLPFKKGYRKVAEGTFVNGLRQGEVTYYYETGEILVTQIYIDNKENGLRKEFYKNGKLKEQGFQNQSIQDSIWSFYNSKGILEKKITYERNRQKHLVEYYQNGTIKLEGNFTQIKIIPKKEKLNTTQTSRRTATKRTSGSLTVKNGEWVYYDKYGKLMKKEKYLKGKLTKNGM
jgi:uncharacterized protein